MEYARRHREDRPATYQIRVQGQIAARWASWFDEITISVVEADRSPTVTTLSGEFVDQAALMGLLQKLYSLGFLLLDVTREELDEY